MLEDVLAQSAWCRENSARIHPLISMSGHAVPGELRSKMELICDMTISLPMHAIPA